MERNVNVIRDVNGNNIVIINDIRFKGKRSVKWEDVKKYLETFVGEFYEIADTKDIVYMGSGLHDEYTGSKYTYSLKGTAAKAKADAAQGIPEMLGTVTGKQFRQNAVLSSINFWCKVIIFKHCCFRIIWYEDMN